MTDAQAENVLARAGPNILPVPAGPPAWRQLLGQMTHFFAVMLTAAAALAFVARLPELAVTILAVVLVNGVFAFVQEHRAEHAAERLRDLLPRRATVVRNGHPRDIDAAQVVPGDLLMLVPGDRIPADCATLDSHGLMIDASSLTGESGPIAVDTGDQLFAGTFVVQGEGSAIAEATGSRTRMAGISELTRAVPRPPTPLSRELRRVVRTIALVALCAGGLFFAVQSLLGRPIYEGFVLAIGITVALVPEGLLPTVTLSLAMAAQRMALRGALVRRLEAVETLGSATFICTDKTGTLTRNEMTVEAVWTPAGTVRLEGVGYEPAGIVRADSPAARGAAVKALRAAVGCSTGRPTRRDGQWQAHGDVMEAAIGAAAMRLGVPEAAFAAAETAGRRFAFDARRRRTSTATAHEVVVKGAPEAVLACCQGPVSRDASAVLAAFATQGLRVLAVASRDVSGTLPATADEAERDLALLGIIALQDPPRHGAADAVAACRRAGIRVAMVTGDHPATAAAIAGQVGLLTPEARVLSGSDLPSEQSALGDLLDRDGTVVARVTPEDKLRIAQALQARGHIVAMTGDGVNDGPALHAADVGVAMGRSGTDVAREAADMVLLDDDFATIVAAVEQGRATYANVRRFLTYHLTDNVAELAPFALWALTAGRFPLALGVLQILALDIGTDSLSAVALGAEPSRHSSLEGPPPRGRLLDRGVARRSFGVLGPVEAAFGIAAFLVSLLTAGWRPGLAFPTGAPLLAASGATFAAVVLAQTANAFACRSTVRTPRELGWESNRLLVAAVAAELAITGVFLLAPPVARLLGHAPPPVAGWAVAALSMPGVLLADRLEKAGRRPAHGQDTRPLRVASARR